MPAAMDNARPAAQPETTIATEELVIRRCRHTGLHAAIAIDSTVLGPAAGGCRRWQYSDEAAGVLDAQRLAAGMSLKNALADIPFGGGKSVIFAPDKRPPTNEQLITFAHWLNELNGRYITAEDVGMGLTHIQTIASHSEHVSGVGSQGVGGDPSPKTAYGVFLGLKTAVQLKLEREHLYGLTVAVQGLGAVGMSLCHWLARAGVQLIVADLDAHRVRQVVKKYDATAVTVDEICSVRADVFAPCAMGGVLDEAFVLRAHFQVIAGAANNQLATDEIANTLSERGILYAPDFVINAGGVVSVAHEHLLKLGQFGQDHNSELWVSSRIDGIRERLVEIVNQAQQAGESTHTAATRMALQNMRPASAVAA